MRFPFIFHRFSKRLFVVDIYVFCFAKHKNSAIVSVWNTATRLILKVTPCYIYRSEVKKNLFDIKSLKYCMKNSIVFLDNGQFTKINGQQCFLRFCQGISMKRSSSAIRSYAIDFEENLPNIVCRPNTIIRNADVFLQCTLDGIFVC